MYATKIRENTTNILNCWFSQYVLHTLPHQAKYPHIENLICLSQPELIQKTHKRLKQTKGYHKQRVLQIIILGSLLFNKFLNDLLWFNEKTDICNFANLSTK